MCELHSAQKAKTKASDHPQCSFPTLPWARRAGQTFVPIWPVGPGWATVCGLSLRVVQVAAAARDRECASHPRDVYCIHANSRLHGPTAAPPVATTASGSRHGMSGVSRRSPQATPTTRGPVLPLAVGLSQTEAQAEWEPLHDSDGDTSMPVTSPPLRMSLAGNLVWKEPQL